MVTVHDRIADALRNHVQAPWGKHDGWWECTCSPNEAHTPEHLASIVQAIEGVAIVELPQPTLCPRHREQVWEVGESLVVFEEKWSDIRGELDYDNGDDDPLSVSDARAFAAALLAAAAEAEKATAEASGDE